MSLLDILLNAAGGGVLGSALHCVTDYFDTRNKVTMLKAQMDAAANASAWAAFQESQKDSAMTIPPNVPVWIASFLALVEGAKHLTRPALTWAAIVIIAGMYFTATPAAQQEMQPQILVGSFTAIFWWFGARYSRSSK